MAGDITPERLAPLLDATFGGLPQAGADREVDTAEPAAPGRLIVVERDIPQSIVVFGARGLARKHPDFYAAYVMNYILGGAGALIVLSFVAVAIRGFVRRRQLVGYLAIDPLPGS